MNASELQCPYRGCDKPDTVEQTSYGGNYADMSCANAHDFAIPSRPAIDEYEEPE